MKYELLMKLILGSIEESLRISSQQLHYRRMNTYGYLEYEANTSLTDADMLKMHINFALENGDKEKFIELSNQLKELNNA